MALEEFDLNELLQFNDQTLPNYEDNNILDGIQINCPWVEIVDQPQKLFRFRYLRESKTPHGPLRGAVSEASSKQGKTGPQLNNFNGEGIIRCWLTIPNSKDPSPHQLVGRNETGEIKFEPHDICVNSSNNYTASFDKLNIIHVVSKDKEYCKYYEMKKLRMNIGYEAPDVDNLKFNTKETINEIKSLEKNLVSLYFEVFSENNGTYVKIGEIISEPIRNTKNPKTSPLKITRACSIRGSCEGGQDVFLLVEKVVKGIKIRFYEQDQETEEEIWSAYADFNPLDIHHQVAIPIRTPRYRDTNITEEVKVFFQLIRENDGVVSPPMTYFYTPSETSFYTVNSKKRKICSPDSSTNNFIPSVINNEINQGSCSNSSIPLAVSGLYSPELKYQDVTSSINYIDLDPNLDILDDEVMTGIDISDYFNGMIHADSVPVRRNDQKLTRVENGQESEILARLLHKAIEENDVTSLVDILPKCLNHKEILEAKNIMHKTPLQMAVLSKNTQMVKMLIQANCSVETVDNNYDTSLHLGVKYFPECLPILMQHCNSDIQEKCNEAGDNVLVLAARLNLVKCVKVLLDNGWDLDVTNLKTGNTSIHVATIYGHENIVHLLLKNGANANCLNNAGYTPFHYAASSGMINILKMILATGIKLRQINKTQSNLNLQEQYLQGPNIYEMEINETVKEFLKTIEQKNEDSYVLNEQKQCIQVKQLLQNFNKISLVQSQKQFN